MKRARMFEAGILVVLAIISLASLNTIPVKAQARNDLDITWYNDVDEAFSALQVGAIDILQWSLTKEQKVAAEADPNLQVAASSQNDFWEFDFNNNWTIDDYPHSLNPLSVEKCRQALACLVDKNYVITTILDSFGSRIDAPIPYPQTESYVNASEVTYDWNHNGVIDPSEDNYPYKYNPEKAAELLAALGFNDTDQNGYLNYPNDPIWMNAAGIDTTLMPMKMCIRSDNYRYFVGRYLWSQLEGNPTIAGDSVLAHAAYWTAHGLIGGDWDTTDYGWEKPRAILSPIVRGARNYHVYTGGWSVGRFPTYLMYLFHTKYWYPWGSNYVTGEAPRDLFWVPEFPPRTEFDRILETGDTKRITEYYVKHCIGIMLWSTTGYTAWRKELASMVNMQSIGLINDFTFLSAYRNPNQPTIRLGVVNTWDELNPLYSMWDFEYALLDRCYSSLIVPNPYDLAVDVPWVAQDWNQETWTDPRDGNSKSIVTYYLRTNAGCASPTSGTMADTLDAHDYEFTCWYNYAFDDDWEQVNFMDLHHLEIVDDHTVKAYFDDENPYFQYAPTYPLLGPAETLTPKLCTKTSVTFHGSDLYNPGYGGDPNYKESQFHPNVVLVINATKNGTPITEGTDFYIRGGYDSNPDWPNEHDIYVPITPLAPSDTITIWYWTQIPQGAGGAYLSGNLGYDWTDTMYSYGTHYPVSITANSASLEKNPHFFLPTPILGEIDWRYYYEGTTKPRNGHFKIEILDLVRCTSAYCSRGDGQYNSAYFPGADLDSSDLCHIGVLDLVTVTSNYGSQFG